MKMQFSQPAGQGERFALDAFDSQRGKMVPVKLADNRTVEGEILSATVSEDGMSVQYTVEIPDESLGMRPDGYSIG